MIILPGHHSESSRIATRDDVEALADDPAETELGMNTQANPDEILQATTAGVGNSETRPTSDPSPPTSVPLPKIDPGDDEYGAELGKDARFWKTYVKEADQWDAELVDGWSK
ncbi:hypothetical protein BDV93DRAFT_249423 [Ceratobasidium sp. AG-I]|nr:hypothetical protein BDV93DRAFT_249423 [Ceratobasidium sp. AG-I]